MNRISKWHGRGKAAGFTLIELLAVIAIIGLLSALVVGLSGLATTKSREARIKGEHARLLTAIESYKAELGNYPPDNPDTNKWPTLADPAVSKFYDRAGRNPLFYELSGATYDNGKFTTLNKAETVAAASLKSELGVDGIENSSRTKGQVPYRQMTFKKDQYAELNVSEDVEILVVPLRGPWDDRFEAKIAGTTGKTKKVNPWFYDATSTNRHNPESFDLWTEYINGKGTNVFGNWKE
jgi:prepilin-type N-terminal cleavage/methylation domain-containing protein